MMIGTYTNDTQIPEEHDDQQWEKWHTNIQRT
jgi:hypothetical protein